MSINPFQVSFLDKKSQAQMSWFERDPLAVESRSGLASARDSEGNLRFSYHSLAAALLIGRPVAPSFSRPSYKRVLDEALYASETHNEDYPVVDTEACTLIGRLAALPECDVVTEAQEDSVLPHQLIAA